MSVDPASLATVIAHQGGWDEFLYFGIPVVLAIAGVRWAEQRAKRRRSETPDAGEEDPAA